MTNRYLTGPDTVIDTDIGKNLVASGGYFSIDLPDPATMPDDCRVTIKNADEFAGKRLTGYLPADVKPRLYPKQSIMLTTAAGAWEALVKPSRYELFGNARIIYVADDAHGGSDSNDGMSPSRPVRRNSTAVAMIEQDIDTQYGTCIIAWIAGSTFIDDPLNISSNPVGGNLIQSSIYGDGDVTIRCADAPGISIGDNGELYQWTNFFSQKTRLILQGNQSNHQYVAYGMCLHNNGLLDQSGKVLVIGSGTVGSDVNSSAYFIDGPTAGAAIADGFDVCGVFGDVFRMDEGGGRLTLSGPIGTMQDGDGLWPFADRMIGLYGTSHLILGGCSISQAWRSLGPSIVSGNAVLTTNGIYVPGGGGPQQRQGGIIASSK